MSRHEHLELLVCPAAGMVGVPPLALVPRLAPCRNSSRCCDISQQDMSTENPMIATVPVKIVIQPVETSDEQH